MTTSASIRGRGNKQQRITISHNLQVHGTRMSILLFYRAKASTMCIVAITDTIKGDGSSRPCALLSMMRG